MTAVAPILSLPGVSRKLAAGSRWTNLRAHPKAGNHPVKKVTNGRAKPHANNFVRRPNQFYK